MISVTDGRLSSSGTMITEAALSNLSFVGNMLIFCVGVNLFFENTKIKVANMLPSILIAVAWAFLPF